jgi:rubrerythrin
MNKTSTDIGTNRTGMDMSPIDKKRVIEGSTVLQPSSPGDESAIAAVLAEYSTDADPIGTMPPPGTLKGAVKAAAKMVKGEIPALLLDKLGERLAFERAGSRLYEALIAKFDALGSFAGGPTREELVEIQDEEVRHFILVAASLKKMGGDPTTQTPSADMQAVASMGIVQVVTDPRTTVAECLEAMLIAELTDNDGWANLVDIASDLGDKEMVSDFEAAREVEHRHLREVRRWVSASLKARATLGARTAAT